MFWGSRCTHGQGVPSHLPRTHSPCAYPPGSHGANIHQLDLGPHDGTLPRTRCARRLLVRRVSGPTRAVRIPSFLFDANKYDPPGWKRLTSVLSINAGISAVVVLASRLHNDLAVFALMLFSVEAFALFPIFRRRIQVSPVVPFLCLLKRGPQSMPAPVQTLVTLLLGLAALAAPLPILCAAVLISVTFGAPAVLMWAQQYK